MEKLYQITELLHGLDALLDYQNGYYALHVGWHRRSVKVTNSLGMPELKVYGGFLDVRQRGGKERRKDVEPRAYLRTIQNVLPGVMSRTRVIRTLRDDWKSAGRISKDTGLSYKVVNYHLHLMENERIVMRRSGRPRVWHLTGLGQQRIISNHP